MNYQITHRTEYTYGEKVTTSHSIGWLVPRELPSQLCEDFRVDISPAPQDLVTHEDFFGNRRISFSLHLPHDQMVIITRSRVRKYPRSNQPELFQNDYSCREVTQKIREDMALYAELCQFILESPFVAFSDEIYTYAAVSFSEERPLVECLKDLTRRIFSDFRFVSGFTTVHTPLSLVMKERKGVCQDFSHLALACIRSMGFPARYVSGYLETLPPPGKEKMIGADASHAWISVYIPGSGWMDFDPTNNVLPDERHIILAWGRDYSDIPPVKGVLYSSGMHTLKVSVDVISFSGDDSI